MNDTCEMSLFVFSRMNSVSFQLNFWRICKIFTSSFTSILISLIEYFKGLSKRKEEATFKSGRHNFNAVQKGQNDILRSKTFLRNSAYSNVIVEI